MARLVSSSMWQRWIIGELNLRSSYCLTLKRERERERDTEGEGHRGREKERESR